MKKSMRKMRSMIAFILVLTFLFSSFVESFAFVKPPTEQSSKKEEENTDSVLREKNENTSIPVLTENKELLLTSLFQIKYWLMKIKVGEMLHLPTMEKRLLMMKSEIL